MKFSKLLRSKKALSPIFAVLILIAIAVIAGIVVYMFTSGTIATMTGGGTAGQEKVAVQAVEYDDAIAGSEALTVWAKSTGGTDVVIDGAIIKSAGGSTYLVDDGVTGALDSAGTLVGISVDMSARPLVAGSYTVTLTSVEGGSFVSASFEP